MSTDTHTRDRATWEAALLGNSKAEGGSAPWERLVSCQIDLRSARKDLLGVSPLQLPIVVALKGPASSKSPLAMLVDATACALALRRAWATGFRHVWAALVTTDPEGLPEKLATCELVCAAPTAYWQRWTGEAATVGPGGWATIADLRRALKRNGFHSAFVRLEHEAADWSGRPIEISVLGQALPGERGQGGAPRWNSHRCETVDQDLQMTA
jgi:hypothetical protein